jgi:serine/threonine protein kinase
MRWWVEPFSKCENTPNPVSFNLKDCKVLRRAGDVSDSQVILNRCKQTFQFIAIKRFAFTRVAERCKPYFTKEISIIGSFSFPSMIKFHGFASHQVKNEINFCSPFEFIENGNLNDFLTKIQFVVAHPSLHLKIWPPIIFASKVARKETTVRGRP